MDEVAEKHTYHPKKSFLAGITSPTCELNPKSTYSSQIVIC